MNSKGTFRRLVTSLALLAAWAPLSFTQEADVPEPEEPKVVLGQLDETAPLEPKSGEGKSRSKFWERWRTGLTASFMSSTDEIRSKSANAVIFRNIQINSSAIRFEPRVGSDGRISMSPVVSGENLDYRVSNDFIRDPRKDIGATIENTYEETYWLDFGAAYDVKTWRHGTLFLQADVGWYQGDIGPVEAAVDIPEQSILNPLDQDLTADDPFANYQYVYPSAGRLQQVPASLAALWQFRPRSPFRPYIGVGVGYLSVDLEESAQLKDLNQELEGIEFSWSVRGEELASGFLPESTITAEAQSDPYYLVHGGLEYNINRRWSVYFNSKYIGTTANVRIKALGFYELGTGVNRNEQIVDAERSGITGITDADALISIILGLPVDEAVALLDDITETSDIPSQNERAYFTTFPVTIGTPVTIEIPNPTDPNGNTQVQRQGKLFVQGGEIGLDSFSVGLGFRYRY